MSDKELSGEEKRALLKEQFKKDLLARKEFVKKVQTLKTSQRINKALSEMTPEDDTQDWIDKLNQESAFTEAKMEMALDSVDLEKEAELQLTEEEMKKILAKDLVEKMKAEMEAEGKVRELGDMTDEVASSEEEGEEGEETTDVKGSKRTMGDLEN